VTASGVQNCNCQIHNATELLEQNIVLFLALCCIKRKRLRLDLVSELPIFKRAIFTNLGNKYYLLFLVVFSLCIPIHKDDLCPKCKDINWLIINVYYIWYHHHQPTIAAGHPNVSPSRSPYTVYTQEN
jgi:hypothetical protein